MDDALRIGSLPDPAEVRVVPTPVGDVYVEGIALGSGSSRAAVHSHDPAKPPDPYQRCSACRWTQITIVRSRDQSGYVVVSEGMSNVAGEVPYGRVTEAEDSESLIRGLFRVDQRGGRDPKPFLPRVALRALTASAERDSEIRETLLGLGYLGC